METAKCIPTEEWLNKVWYIYMMESCSAIQKNTDTCNNMAKSQKYYAEWEKPYIKQGQAVWTHLYEVLKQVNLFYGGEEIIIVVASRRVGAALLEGTWPHFLG